METTTTSTPIVPPAGKAITASPPQGKATGNNVMTVPLALGEDPDVAMAKARLHPVVNAGHTIRVFEKSLADHPFGSLATELSRHVEDVKAGKMNRPEAMLMMQAHSLDAIFNNLAQRAGANIGSNAEAADRYLRMALKAQSQCRTTLEALAEIKAPKSSTFIRQANIAEQQQVNNGPTVNGVAGHACAHEEKSEDATTKLISEDTNATLDTGGTGTAGGTNPQLETVGAVDRPKNRGRKNAQ